MLVEGVDATRAHIRSSESSGPHALDCSRMPIEYGPRRRGCNALFSVRTMMKGELEDHSAVACRVAAARGRAVKTPFIVQEQISLWVRSVRAPGERVENRLFAAWIQLEHHFAAESAAGAQVSSVGCSAVEIALRVSDDARERLSPACASGKAVEHALVAFSIHLEHHSAPDGATCVGPQSCRSQLQGLAGATRCALHSDPREAVLPLLYSDNEDNDQILC
jgi:hypothetical protein